MTGFRPHHSLLTETITATGTITANHFVGFDGAQANSTGQKTLGVAGFNAKIGDTVPVFAIGYMSAIAGSTIAIGDDITCDDQGRAIPLTDPATQFKAGVAVAAAVANGVVQFITK